MLILQRARPRRDARAFETAGIRPFEQFDFEREGKRPDGSAVKLAFSLAFATDPAVARHRHFTVCQQHYPENFWNPAFQVHAEWRTAPCPAPCMVADNPTDHHIFLKAFTGSATLQSTSIGVRAQTPRGEIEIMEPVAFREQFGVPPDLDARGDDADALRFEVADLEQAESRARRSGLALRGVMLDTVVIPPDVAYGATLIFEAAK